MVKMKKVLVLSSSPRKGGNSDILCDEFILGAKESGNDVEKIFLKDKKINYCVACEYCTKNNGICIQKDDMADILDKIVKADVIVMATPVYFYTRYTEIKNKEFYFVATAADNRKEALERTIEGFRGLIDCLDGAVEKDIIYGIGAWKVGEIKNTNAMKEAYEMGKSL